MHFNVVPDLWVIEYSHRQGAFHKAKISEAVRKNLWSFFRAAGDDYTIIAVARNEAELTELLALLDARKHRTAPFDRQHIQNILRQFTTMNALNFYDTLDLDDSDDDADT